MNQSQEELIDDETIDQQIDTDNTSSSASDTDNDTETNQNNLPITNIDDETTAGNQIIFGYYKTISPIPLVPYTSDSDSDTDIYHNDLQIINVNNNTTKKLQMISEYRTKVSHVPVIYRQYFLKPGPNNHHDVYRASSKKNVHTNRHIMNLFNILVILVISIYCYWCLCEYFSDSEQCDMN